MSLALGKSSTHHYTYKLPGAPTLKAVDTPTPPACLNSGLRRIPLLQLQHLAPKGIKGSQKLIAGVAGGGGNAQGSQRA